MLYPIAHGKRRMQGSLGVIFQRDGSAKNRHDAIADELVDHSLVLVDGVGQVL